MVEDSRDEEKRLVMGPSTSPENSFELEDGTVAYLDMGVSMDQQMVWETFTNVLQMAEVLNIQNEFVDKVRDARDRLLMPQIDSQGRIMEWTKEFKEHEPGHRHMSHLYGLHPGFQYNYRDNPEMVEAARKTIDARLAGGGGHTGWSRAWIINFWARFKEAEKAYENIRQLLIKSTHPNLFDNHPPDRR